MVGGGESWYDKPGQYMGGHYKLKKRGNPMTTFYAAAILLYEAVRQRG